MLLSKPSIDRAICELFSPVPLMENIVCCGLQGDGETLGPLFYAAILSQLTARWETSFALSRDTIIGHYLGVMPPPPKSHLHYPSVSISFLSFVNIKYPLVFSHTLLFMFHFHIIEFLYEGKIIILNSNVVVYQLLLMHSSDLIWTCFLPLLISFEWICLVTYVFTILTYLAGYTLTLTPLPC